MNGQITVPAREPEAITSPHECRVYLRSPCQIPAKCNLPSAGGNKEIVWPGTIQDISQGGVALILKRRFERGTGLLIELPGASPDSVTNVLARVVRVKSHKDGLWLLGCAFVSHLSEEELESTLTASPLSPIAAELPLDDHRGDNCDINGTQKRHESLVKGVHVHVVLPGGGVIRWVFQTLDLSAVSFLEKGSVLEMRAGDVPPGIPVGRVRVNYWGQRSGTWTLEGTLLDSLPQAAANLFNAQRG